jgi:putative SOS response-associated peptidase YedK
MPRGALQGEPSILGVPPYAREAGEHCFVLARDPESGDAIPAAMRWGLPLAESKRRRLHLRVDQLAGRRFGRMLRCIVPASGYVQPGFRRSHIAITFAAPMSLAIAAVWKQEAGGSSFAIITTEASDELAPALSQMPVLLPPALWPRWLSDTLLTTADLALLSRPAPAAWLRAEALRRAPPHPRSLSVTRQIEDWAPGSAPRQRPVPQPERPAASEVDRALG